MQVQTERDGQLVSAKHVYIWVDGVKYTLSETIDNKLCLNKEYGLGGEDSDCLKIYPRYSNEINVK